MTTALLLGAVVLGWAFQTLLTYRQTTAFRRQAADLRRLGTVSVGAGGRRYRGGRGYVALAVDEAGRVRGALVLRGWTTFSRARPLPAAVGLRAGKLAVDAHVPGLDQLSRSAARQAAQLYLDARSRSQEPTTSPPPPAAPASRRGPVAQPLPQRGRARREHAPPSS